MYSETIQTAVPGRFITIERDGGLLTIRVGMMGERAPGLVLEDVEARQLARVIQENFPADKGYLCFSYAIGWWLSFAVNIVLLICLLALRKHG